MKSLLRSDWIQRPDLKQWATRSCIDKTFCSCKSNKHHVELWEHDSCYRGRIDTTICTKCNSVVKIKIIK